VSIVRGAHGRDKLGEVVGLDEAALNNALAKRMNM